MPTRSVWARSSTKENAMRKFALIALLPLLPNCAASASTAAPPAEPSTAPAQSPAPPPATAAPATQTPAAETAPPEPAPAAVLGESLQQHPLVQEQLGYYAVVTPPDYDSAENAKKRFPVVVVLHDKGQNESSAAILANSLGREGAIYVMPRAPYPIAGEGGGFTASPNYPKAWGSSDAESFPSKDLEQLNLDKLYATQIANAIKDTRKRYRANWSKVVVVGQGEGATSAHQFVVNQPWMVKAYVASGGQYEGTTESKRGPAHVAALKSNNIAALIIHQEGDPVVASASSKKLGEMLEKGRVDYKGILTPGTSHELSADGLSTVKRFVRHHCCGEPLEAPAPLAPAPEKAQPVAPAAQPPAPAQPAAPPPAAAAPAKPAATPAKPAAAPAKPAAAPAKPAAPTKPATAPTPVANAGEKKAPEKAPAPKKDVPAKATVPSKQPPAAQAAPQSQK